jgi:hypothetical protein
MLTALSLLLIMFYSGSYASIRPIRYPVFHIIPRHPDADFASLLRRVCRIGEKVCRVLSVRPPAWNNSAPTGQILMQVRIYGFLENLSKKIRFPLKSDEYDGYFT